MKTIPILSCPTAIVMVDDEDYDKLIKFKWSLTQKGHVCATVNRKTVYMHQLLLSDLPEGYTPDHKDRNSLNNQKDNLRPATYSQQMCNTERKGRLYSKYRGVTFHKRDNKWQACIRFQNKVKFLGYFLNEKEAALAYNKTAKILHGEFATLNEVI